MTLTGLRRGFSSSVEMCVARTVLRASVWSAGLSVRSVWCVRQHVALEGFSHHPTAPGPGRPLSSLSPCACPSWMFRTNGITRYRWIGLSRFGTSAVPLPLPLPPLYINSSPPFLPSRFLPFLAASLFFPSHLENTLQTCPHPALGAGVSSNKDTACHIVTPLSALGP